MDEKTKREIELARITIKHALILLGTISLDRSGQISLARAALHEVDELLEDEIEQAEKMARECK